MFACLSENTHRTCYFKFKVYCTNIRKESEDITTDKTIVKEYYELLYAHKCDKLDEMD